jgi:F-type H+-transporting ATPase subunit b
MSITNLAAEEKENFLLPNGTFWVEAAIFAVVLYVMWRFVVPPIRDAMAKRREMIQRGLDEGRAADEKFRQAEQRYEQALAEARSEAARIRDTARAEGQKTLDELRGHAGAEVAQIRKRAAEQLAGQRAQVIGELQPHVRELAVALAGRVVGESVAVRKGRL